MFHLLCSQSCDTSHHCSTENTSPGFGSKALENTHSYSPRAQSTSLSHVDPTAVSKVKLLFKHHESHTPARFTYLGCDHQEGTCLSTWWSETDETTQSVHLQDLNIQSPKAHIILKSFDLSLPPLQLDRIHKTFGPPNSLHNQELDPKSVHHRFIYHKRQSMPCYSMLFAIIAACAALLLNFSQCLAVLGGLGLIGFGLLRSLELLARADFLSPVVAAWSPACLLLMISIWSIYKLQQSPPKLI